MQQRGQVMQQQTAGGGQMQYMQQQVMKISRTLDYGNQSCVAPCHVHDFAAAAGATRLDSAPRVNAAAIVAATAAAPVSPDSAPHSHAPGSPVAAP